MTTEQLTAEQQRRIRASAEKFKRDLVKHGMTVEGVTEKDGVPTINIRIEGKEANQEPNRKP